MSRDRHLIALDLDGTLLTDKKEISVRTKKILAQVIEQGHIVVIATGRSHRTSIQYYRMLGLTTPIVNFNGAFIHHPQDKKWKALHNPLPQQTAQDVIDACYQLNVSNIVAKVQDNIYIDKHDQQIIDVFQSIQTKNEFEPLNIGNIKAKLMKDPTSMLIFPRREIIDELKSHLNDHHADIIEHRNWGEPWNITEIIKKGINKAVGLQKVAEHYNIPKNRIIAFGDEGNDMEMIEYAGVGVAMENAINELKSIAKHVTNTNEQDGVGSFLEEYLKVQVSVS